MRFIIVLLLYIVSLSAQTHHNQKLLMIFATAKNCQWCHKMQKEVFDDPKVSAILQKEYILVKLVREDGNFPDFIHPQYFPTTYVFDPVTLKIIDSLAGYRTKEKFLKFFYPPVRAETEEDF